MFSPIETPLHRITVKSLFIITTRDWFSRWPSSFVPRWRTLDALCRRYDLGRWNRLVVSTTLEERCCRLLEENEGGEGTNPLRGSCFVQERRRRFRRALSLSLSVSRDREMKSEDELG